MSIGQNYQPFAEHIALLLDDNITNPLKREAKVIIKHKDKTYVHYRIKTKTLPIFNSFHDLYYEYDEVKGKYKKKEFL